MKNNIRRVLAVVATCATLMVPRIVLGNDVTTGVPNNSPTTIEVNTVLESTENDVEDVDDTEVSAPLGDDVDTTSVDPLEEPAAPDTNEDTTPTEKEEVSDTSLAHPNVTATVSTNGDCRLSWLPVKGAERYAIAVRRDGSWFTYTYSCTNTWYDLSQLTAGRTYEFLVQAYDGGRWSDFDKEDIVAVTWDGTTSPQNVVATATGDGEVTIAWDEVAGADAYAIAEKLDDGSYRTFSYHCIQTTFTVSNLSNGCPHRFLVQARVDGSWSPISDYLLVEATPEGRTKPQLNVTQDRNQCVLSWSKVSGASRYAIASKNDDGSWRTYDYNFTGLSYHLSGLEAGRTYTFLVQAYVDGFWTGYTLDDTVQLVYMDTSSPQHVAVAPTSNDGELEITWDAVEGASRYAVAELLSNGTYYALNNDIPSSQLSYVDSNLWPGRSYSYLVQAYVNGRWSAVSKYLTVSAIPAGDAKPVVKATPTNDGAVLSWKRVPGATSYAVAVRVGSIWHTYTYNQTATSFSITGMDPGNPYHFLVQAKVNDIWTDFSDADVVTVEAQGSSPVSPRPLFYVSYSNNSIKVNWEPVPGATRYAIAQKLPDGSYSTYSLNATGNSYTISNFADGGDRTYKILVQAYKNGQWSNFTDADLRSVYVPAQLSEAERLLVARVQKYNYFSRTNYMILVDVTRTDVGIFQYNGGWHLIKYFQCSCGAPSTPTVIGQFELGAKGYSFGAGTGHTCYWYSQIYGAYLFHSVLYKEGSHTEFVDDRIGYHISGGCVRLQIDNAKYIYDNIPSGTRVVTYL